MKIAEMNNCIEKMREIYKFDDEKTEIALNRTKGCSMENLVKVETVDKSGIQIIMTGIVVVIDDDVVNWTDFYKQEDD